MWRVWELRGGKGALKKKQTTAIKSQMANIWTTCGWAEHAAVWITKVWQIFYSVLIWLSLLAFSFFGSASPIWAKMPFHEAVYCWGLSGRLSVLFSTSLCLCAAGEGSHNVWWLFTSYSLPCAWNAPLYKPLQLHRDLLFESLVLQDTSRSPLKPTSLDMSQAERFFMMFLTHVAFLP